MAELRERAARTDEMSALERAINAAVASGRPEDAGRDYADQNDGLDGERQRVAAALGRLVEAVRRGMA